MYTLTANTAAVIGARHLAAARNGQDAAASWVGDGAGAIVVCDGCGAGGSSEVGARLGAQLVIGAAAARLSRGESPATLWPGVRAEVVEILDRLISAMPGDRPRVIHDHWLFTVVAAAVAGDEVCVWAIGDGAYRVGGRTVALGSFAENQPPYLAYDLLGMPADAVLDVGDARGGLVAVATDGAADLLDMVLDDRTLANPDGLRRRLAVAARDGERVDWDARRIVRSPAVVQDDAAIAALRWVL